MKRGCVQFDLGVEPVFVIDSAEVWVRMKVKVARTDRDPRSREISDSRTHEFLVEFRYIFPGVMGSRTAAMSDCPVRVAPNRSTVRTATVHGEPRFALHMHYDLEPG